MLSEMGKPFLVCYEYIRSEGTNINYTYLIESLLEMNEMKQISEDKAELEYRKSRWSQIKKSRFNKNEQRERFESNDEE